MQTITNRWQDMWNVFILCFLLYVEAKKNKHIYESSFILVRTYTTDIDVEKWFSIWVIWFATIQKKSCWVQKLIRLWAIDWLLDLLKTSSALLDSALEICFTQFGKRLYDYVMWSYLYYKKNNIGIDDKYATIENILK